MNKGPASLMLLPAFMMLLQLLLPLPASGQESFREKQKLYSRVNAAYTDKLPDLSEKCESRGIDMRDMEIFIVGYKQERQLEVWAKNRSDPEFTKLLNYRFCILSGQIGPKRMEGDLQVPEGFYHIDVFNPVSNFHLSMGINYPNRSDRILGVGRHLGGDIYIHGSCVSIGCIPITTNHIKELYVLCVEAKNGGEERIPVHLYPARLEEGVVNELIEKYEADEATQNLWEDMQKAYDYFKVTGKIPKIQFLGDGRHKIN